MSGKKDDPRSQRSSALADKKKRLEELKARRSTRQQQAAAATTTSDNVEAESTLHTISSPSAISASRTGNLDEYIDGLLNSTLPIGASATPITNVSTANVSSTASASGATIPIAEVIPDEKSDSISHHVITTPTRMSYSGPTEASVEATVVPQVKVETFEICTQTEDDDFPISMLNDIEDGQLEKGDEDRSDNKNQDDNNEDKDNSKNNDNKTDNTATEPKLLNEDEINETTSTNEFASFFNSASKKVERFLGSSILSDLLVDDMLYYTDLQSKRDGSSKSTLGKSSHSLISAQVSFEYPTWTRGRDITSIDWSVHHRGEVLLASYHMRSSSSSNSNTVVSSLGPHSTPSSSLLPRSRSEMTQADGLNIVWNLTMPNRPEHVLTCGSPVLESRFHPTEGNLIVGACYSGQVVVWDVRSGRLPVQRSSLNLLGGSGTSSNGGHVHPVVGMEVLEGGAGFVTAASDGVVNFWSLANLIEPAESLKIPSANLTSIAVAPESQSIIAGDECGSMYAIVSSSSGTRSSSSTSTSRRSIRKIYGGTKQPGDNNMGHYGPLTGLSTKVTSKVDNVNGISLSKGFACGTKGMVLTCGVDWTTKLWAPAYSDKPLLSLLSHSYDYMSDVQWSPIHPSIFATASSNGSLSFWNLSTSLDEPVTGVDGIVIEKNVDTKLSQRGLNKLKWSADGRRIAAACSDTLYVIGLSEDLWKISGDEEDLFMNNLKGRGLLDYE